MNAIAKIVRRLERLELQHLRRHAADLAERLERAEDEAARASDDASFWHQQCMTVLAELQDTGTEIGMTKDGAIIVGYEAGVRHEC